MLEIWLLSTPSFSRGLLVQCGPLGSSLRGAGSWDPFPPAFHPARKSHPVWSCGDGKAAEWSWRSLPWKQGLSESGTQGCPLALPAQKPHRLLPSALLGAQQGRSWVCLALATQLPVGPTLSSGLALCLAHLWHCLGNWLPADGCKVMPCAGRPSPELKVGWGQAHAPLALPGRPNERRLVREGPHFPSGQSPQCRAL